GLPLGDHQQNLPQVVPVEQLREAAALGGPAEAVEGTQGDVFLVAHPARGALEPLAGQQHESVNIALPKLRGGRTLAGLELIDPDADRVVVCHGQPAVTGKTPGPSSYPALYVLDARFQEVHLLPEMCGCTSPNICQSIPRIARTDSPYVHWG